MSIRQLLTVAAVSLLLSGGMLEVVLRWARTRLLDVPNDRSSHTTPTPRGGGIAVITAVLLVTPLAVRFVGVPTLGVGPLVACLAALAGIAGISWIDDRMPLPAKLRLCVHVLMALIVVTVSVHGLTTLALGWRIALAPLLLFWLVGVTNAYNFMDGIDGIAGAQAVVAGCAWAIVGMYLGAPVTAVTAVVIAASALAFLQRNWSPAAIFMGDVGSASLGFLLAALPVLFALELQSASAPPLAMMVGILAIWPFLFDATFTIVQRLRRGERLTEAHRGHLYQRLVIAGASHATVSTVYAGFAFTGGAAALLLAYDPRAGMLALPAIPLQALWLVRFAQSLELRIRMVPPPVN